MTAISIIIPTLNEAQALPATLQSLQPLKQQGVEIIIVDGGSIDQTLNIAEQYGSKALQSKIGRASQMNVGAEHASGELLLFLHADTRLPHDALILLMDVAEAPEYWGRFNVKLDGNSWVFRVIESMMNVRSCLTGVVTGDHAIFVSKRLFHQINGLPQIELMEDIAFSKLLKQKIAPRCLSSAVTTSSRRWEQRGVFRTVLVMWWLRLAYYFGAKPSWLSRQYQAIR
jgi:rSAM/selenodomain-associated transferase 2